MSRKTASSGRFSSPKTSSRNPGVSTVSAMEVKRRSSNVMDRLDSKREITRPLGSQSPQMMRWKDTLRSAEGGSSSYLNDNLFSSLKKGGTSSSTLRKSTGNLAANFGSSTNMSATAKSSRGATDLEHIEGEYIKNLQQQVYFLELEANYLREQAKKATEMHPQMTAEAELMLNKLRQMQAEVDGLQVEIKRKESNLDMVSTERERVQNRLKVEEDSHQREKRLLLDEIVQLKKEKDLIDREGSRKDTQTLQAREELDKCTTALKSAESKMQMLRGQLDQKCEQHKLTQSALDEKRSDLMKTETQLREMEEKYYNSTATIQDKLVQDLRDEIRMLRQKLKETEMSSEQERYMRSKLSDDSGHLVKENALFSQQKTELQRQLEREKSLRDSNDQRRSQNITELVLMKDREKQLQFELEQSREMLRHEQERSQHLMQQMSKQEQVSTATELNATTNRSRLLEIEEIHQKTESDNAQLRRDKMLLVDHVSDLQKQADDKETEIITLRTQLHSMETRLKELEHLKDLETSLHSQKWDEFSRLADSMKSLSRTMARTGSPNSRSNPLFS